MNEAAHLLRMRDGALTPPNSAIVTGESASMPLVLNQLRARANGKMDYRF